MKASVSILSVILLSSPTLFPQVKDRDSVDSEVFVRVETTPEFVGGRDAMFNFLAKNLKYPKEAYQSDVAGKVFVQFVVEIDGKISNVKVIKGVTEALDQEAVRVVNEMPKWKAGTQQGKPVRTQFVLPINFQIPKKN